jgi:hypothetical protein
MYHFGINGLGSSLFDLSPDSYEMLACRKLWSESSLQSLAVLGVARRQSAQLKAWLMQKAQNRVYRLRIKPLLLH